MRLFKLALRSSVWFLAFLLVSGCDERPATKQSQALTMVPSSQVCMVNNQYMGKPQIPIELEGRTYFGCCEMCKGRLANDSAIRFAVDPQTGRRVDKATAVIAQDAAGAVVYFESKDTLDAYLSRAAPK